MAKNDRFQVIHKEGNGLSSPQIMVLMDSVTGVQYLFTQSGYAGGLCPLVDKEGGPLTWDV
ncbi:MAG: xylan 1,4-beta-xylosidase [Oscillospiraceae bacterium]|nr:xylan 1,4-beta-xylosidase [Oscillospiraceae bacterium]MDE6839766.1 xylan 1,4-beta-xylosidase [Oscillospiraceae bacterium]